MKINLEAAPASLSDYSDVVVGNVYQSIMKFYVIFAIIERSSMCGNDAVALTLNPNGEISGIVIYKLFYFSRQRLVGFAHVPEMIDVSWL